MKFKKIWPIFILLIGLGLYYAYGLDLIRDWHGLAVKE
jgi:hypothetical protein